MNDLDSTSTDEILDKNEILEKIRMERAAERRTIRLNVSAARVASLIPFTKTPKEPVRWAMNAICFEPAPAGGVFIIATDLQTVVVRHDPDGLLTTPGAKPLLISPFAGQTKALHPVFAGLQNPKPYSAIRLIIQDDWITQQDGRPGTYDLEPLLVTEGNFPKWRSIIAPFLKAKPYTSTAAFPANLLARFDFQPKHKANEAHAVLLWQEPLADPNETPNGSPIFVTSPYPDSADMIGAFMPLDANRHKHPLTLIMPHREWVTTIKDSADPQAPSTSDSNGRLAA